MEFNRMISLVLGFIVLILVFVWIASRFRSTTKVTTGSTVTVTMTPTVTPTKSPSKGWNPFGIFSKETPTPTPTQKKVIVKKVSTTPTRVMGSLESQGTVGNTTLVYKNNRNGKTTSYTVTGVQSIPNTGAPTLVIPLALSALTFGAYLRKRS
jgi:hypothetical protein